MDGFLRASISLWVRSSMADMNSATELDRPQHKRERHGGKRDQHQNPKRIHVAQEGRLGLHLLSDPLHRLVMRTSLCGFGPPRAFCSCSGPEGLIWINRGASLRSRPITSALPQATDYLSVRLGFALAPIADLSGTSVVRSHDVV